MSTEDNERGHGMELEPEPDILPKKRRKLEHGDSGEYENPGDRVSMECPKYLHHFFDHQDNHSKAAIVFDNGKGKLETISYGTVDNNANYIRDLLQNEVFQDAEFIGVFCQLGILYPSVILGILRSRKALFNIDPARPEKAVLDGIRQLNLKYVICDHEHEPFLSFTSQISFRQLENLPASIKLAIYEVSAPTLDVMCYAGQGKLRRENEKLFAYAIQTSGTTGNKKTVIVPHSCICPNVYDFIHSSWKMTSQDIVFGCAPPTFDPHIVELFTALAVGATVLYTTASVKSNSSLLASLLISHHVTILQITPSLFRKTYEYFLRSSLESSLRIVAFGGEKCPDKVELNFMKEALCSSSEVIFQNIYGVTEVSCWATVSSIDIASNSPITIGEPIIDTAIYIENEEDVGEIIISSDTRRCIIIYPSQNNGTEINPDLFKSKFEYRTGDLGRLVKEGIIFEGRADRIVKRNGIKVRLCKLEEMTYATGLVSYAECFLHRSKIYLAVQLKPQYRHSSSDDMPETVISYLNKRLDIPLFMYPDFIISLTSIPLNNNGKIDFSCVLNSWEESNKNASVPYQITNDEIIKTIEPIWRSCTWPGLRTLEYLLKEKFFEVGGNSISAARFVESTFLSLKLFGTEIHVKYENELMQRLFQDSFQSLVELISEILSSQKCITAKFANFINDLAEIQPHIQFPLPFTGSPDSFEHHNLQNYEEHLLEGNVFSRIRSSDDYTFKKNLKIVSPVKCIEMYDFPLGLCVDASPTILNGVGSDSDKALVGCHGGILICIDLSLLHSHITPYSAIAWKRRMPGRLEASVVADKDSLFGYVGCHDCNFYKFSIANGDIICYTRCDAPIRSKCAIVNDHECIIFIDSGDCIYCLNCHDLNVIWVQKSYKFLATTNLVTYKNLCYISSLSNGLLALDILTGEEVWSSGNNRQYSSPLLVNTREGCKNRKKQNLVITGSLMPNNSDCVEARNCKNGSIQWKHISPTTSLRQKTPQQLAYNKCCNVVFWIFTLESYAILKSLDPSELNCRNNETCFSNSKDSKEEIFSTDIGSVCICLTESVAAQRDRHREHKQECVLFCKLRRTNKLLFINLHDKNMEIVKPWFLIKEFDTFSTPVTASEFILFGGRDNKLHAIRCKGISENK